LGKHGGQEEWQEEEEKRWRRALHGQGQPPHVNAVPATATQETNKVLLKASSMLLLIMLHGS